MEPVQKEGPHELYPHKHIEKKEPSLSIDEWEYNPQLHDYYIERLGRNDFVSFLGNFKRQCKAKGYDYSDWDRGLREFIDNASLRQQGKKAKQTRRPVEVSTVITEELPKQTLSFRHNVFYREACKAVISDVQSRMRLRGTYPH